MGNDDIYIGSYRLISKLGGGAFGNVYKAQHAILSNRIVALKLLHLDYVENQEAILRFLTESQILEKLRHPYILPIITVDIHNGFPYQITEYASKGSLRDRLQLQPLRPLPLAEAIRILSQVGQALQYAHDQNIVHRDLKPENILFNEKGDAIVADFGIATILSTSSIKQTSPLGTYHYMAPEEYQDLICKESDQYALGYIAYELFTGHLPFEASSIAATIAKHLTELPVSPRTFNPDLPEHMAKAVLKALAKQRAERFTNISAFITALITTPSKLSQEAKDDHDGSLQLDSNKGAYIPYDLEGSNDSSRIEEDFKAYVNSGYMMYELHSYEEALAAYDRATEIIPGSAFAQYGKGMALSMLGRNREAISAFELATHINPKFYDAYYGLGIALYHLHYYSEALVAFEQVIRLAPSKISAWFMKGGILLGLNRDHDALTACEELIRLEPNSADAFNMKGLALQGLERYTEAIAAYEQTVRFDPNHAEAYNNMGDTFFQLTRNEEALAAFEEAIRLKPDFALAYNGKGNVYLELAQYSDAFDAFDMVIELVPNYAEAYENKGIALTECGHYHEALLAYEQAMKLHPNNAGLWYNKGKTLLIMQQYNNCLQAFERAIQLNPKLINAYNGMGNTLNILERFDDALTTFEQATRMDPNNANAFNGKGIALNSLKRLDEALIAFDQAIRLDPKEAMYHINKANVLRQQGKLAEAQQAYENFQQLRQGFN